MTPDALRRLEKEAERLRDEAYPGDLMEDIRPRLDALSPPGARPGRRWPWLVPAAAVLALVSWLSQRRQDPPPRPSAARSTATTPPPRGLALLPAQSLSPFQTVSVSVPPPPAVGLPTLSATGLPSVSTALRGGARALSQVRPPHFDPKEEER